MPAVYDIWTFFQTQVLGMSWLNQMTGAILALFGLDISSRVGGNIHFFFYDVIKIMLLLSVLIFLISYIQSYFPPERTKRILSHVHGIWANILAALMGTVTPFCSCSSIPLFIGFTSAGLPVGLTFSFLISSPLVDLGSLLLIMSIFGVKVAVAYVILGIVLAVTCGTLIGKMKMEKYLEPVSLPSGHAQMYTPEMTKGDRASYAWDQVRFIVKKVFWYVIGGVAIGAAIHNWIPETVIQGILGSNNPFSVLIATLVGVPMYADIFGTIPIAEALYTKGVGLGTILSFMMAVTALSLPSIILLRRVVKPKLLALFVGVVTSGIIVIGYLFNAIEQLLM